MPMRSRIVRVIVELNGNYQVDRMRGRLEAAGLKTVGMDYMFGEIWGDIDRRKIRQLRRVKGKRKITIVRPWLDRLKDQLFAY